MNAMLADAVILMAIGMATVFTFLLVLTACVTLLTRLTADPAVATAPAKAAATNQPDAAQMAAISSAIAQYRKSR
ncbi:MAG: OadG family protein [Idiomarina sp.]|nr:OadG family protein [Idiomarina sp.]